MAVADRVSFFSRFTMKFVEVIGAGIATAITGYLIAHLGGFLPAPAPAALQSAPSVSTISKASIFKSSRAQPVAPVATNADAKEPAAKPAAGPSRDANAPAAQPARATAAATATPLPARKSATDIGAIESKPRDAESVEEQVRAALAKVDAMRPRPPEPAAQQLEISPAPPAVAIQPRPAEPAVGSIAAVPPAAAIAPQLAPQPAQLAPVPLPLGTVEIKSQPVADVAATPTPPAPDNAQASAPEDKGILATLKKIPDMLRPASGATTTPPRPPLPVGQ